MEALFTLPLRGQGRAKRRSMVATGNGERQLRKPFVLCAGPRRLLSERGKRDAGGRGRLAPARKRMRRAQGVGRAGEQKAVEGDFKGETSISR